MSERREAILNAIVDAPKDDLLEMLAIVVMRCVRESVDGREFRRVIAGAMKVGISKRLPVSGAASASEQF